MSSRAPTFPTAADQSSTPAAGETPEVSTPAQPSATEGEESSGDEEDASDEGEPEADDADAKAEEAERKQQREEINDLEREVENQRRKVEGQKNMLLRDRAMAQLRILEEDLRVKRGVFGFDEEGNDTREPRQRNGGGEGEGGDVGDRGNGGLFGDEEDAEGESEEE